MGLFDTLDDHRFKCPHCKSRRSVYQDIQTKDLGSMPSLLTFSVHYPGDPRCNCRPSRWDAFIKPKPHAIAHGRRYVCAITSCHSPICDLVSRAEAYLEESWFSGHGRSIELRYDVDERARVCGPGKVVDSGPAIHEVPRLMRRFARKLRSRPGDLRSFKPVLELCGGEWTTALLMWTPRFRRRPGRRPRIGSASSEPRAGATLPGRTARSIRGRRARTRWVRTHSKT